MENNIKQERLEFLLREVILLIENSLENNPFKDLKKSLNIVQQRNYKQYPSVKNKIKNVSMIIYGDRFHNADIINKYLSEIYSILSE